MWYVSSIGTCPTTTTASVNLSASFEEDGRAFACPGELVVFTCRAFHSTTVQIVAEHFICRALPVTYIAADLVGSPGRTRPNDLFLANLTDVQRESARSMVANFTATLKVNTTSETTGKVVECFGLHTLMCDVLRKNLMQSGTQLAVHFQS